MADAEQDAFDEAAAAVIRLYAEKRYAEALVRARDAAELFPEWRATTSFWAACLLSLIGDHDAAIAELADGLEHGAWWGAARLREDPDLAPLRGRADFDAIVDAARALQATHPSRPALEILRPPVPVRGLVIALHGAGGMSETTRPRWDPATGLGYIVGLPLSSQRWGSDSDGRTWDDPHVALREVTDVRNRLVAEFEPVGTLPIFAGFSQGGRRILKWVLADGPLDVRRFVVVGPGVRSVSDEMKPQLAAAARSGVRGAFVVGEQDFMLEPATHMHRAMLEAGIHVRLDVVPGVEHAFPPDFADRLPDLLAFVDPP